MKLFRGGATLATALLLSLSAAPAAYAHAAYESSDPANQATVSSPPSRVTAEFTEPVVDESQLDVYDPCGSQVDSGDSFVAADRITVSMSSDKQGTYTVRFSVISAVDSHPTNGEFTFTSTGGAPCPGDEPEEEQPTGGAGNEPSGSGGSGGASGTGSEGGSGGADNDASSATTSGSARSGARAGNEGPRGNNVSQASSKDASAGRRPDETRQRAGSKVAGARLENTSTEIGPSAISASDIENIWDGIPLVGFLVALLVAAAIGGAGGLVYAGIMGPRD